MYSEGHGVKKNSTKAIKFYRRSAELGNRAAKCDLGVMLLDGETGAQDEHEAVSLITAAAFEGHAISQFSLGMIYYYQVPRDPEKAEYWLRQAVKHGDTQAQEYIDEWF